MLVSAEAMEIHPSTVDLDIFHALIYARRAAGVPQWCRNGLESWMPGLNSGFRGCEEHRKNSQDDSVTMPVRGWRRPLPHFGVSLVNARRREPRRSSSQN